jgi:UPF0755 protein
LGIKKTIFRIFGAMLVFLVAAAGIAVFLNFEVAAWVTKAVQIPAPKLITVGRGASLTGIAENLEHQGIIDSSVKFRIYVRVAQLFPHFQAGLYQFSGNVTPTQIIEAITHGDVYKPLAVEFTVPEGFTMYQIRDRLVAHGIGTQSSLTHLLTDKAFIKELGITSPSLEGYLYPATYQFFTTIPSERDAIKRMTAEFFKRLPEGYAEKAKQLNLTLPQSVIFASLIERETLHDDERPLVSEVIWARLKDGGPLGIDAALIYGIENYDGDIKWRDLKNAQNLYNTRIHKGLPPTPIASPSVASLLAVLNPADKRYYYYVRKPGPDNRHQFSRTLQEHNEYVQKWIRGN